MEEQRLNWDSISDNYYTGILLGNGQLGTNIYKENNHAIRFDIEDQMLLINDLIIRIPLPSNNYYQDRVCLLGKCY